MIVTLSSPDFTAFHPGYLLTIIDVVVKFRSLRVRLISWQYLQAGGYSEDNPVPPV
jgi:hypothetical protein